MRTMLSFDLGTGGVKAALYSAQPPCAMLAETFLEYPTYNTLGLPGVREQRPMDWWQAVVDSAKAAMDKVCVSGGTVAAIGLSGHSLGMAAMDGEGNLLEEYTPIWSDDRAIQEADEYFARVSYEEWYCKTGNGFPRGTYPLFKLMWHRKHQPELFAKAVHYIGTKDYINYRLTGVIATDPSYASGCGGYSLKDRAYAPELFEAAELSPDLFPEIVPSGGVMGFVSADAAALLGVKDGTKVICGGVDNALMALGARCCEEGDNYLSLGTSAWIALASAEPVLDFQRRPYVFDHCIPDRYVSSTCIFSAGYTLRWVRDNFFSDFGPDAAYGEINRLAAQVPPGSRGIFINPSLAGGSEIEPNHDIRGAIVGLEQRHTRGDIARATMEGVTMNLRTARDVLAKYRQLQPHMLLVGGGAKSPLWRQIFADVFDMEIRVTQVRQSAAALGAAALCAQALGVCDIKTMLDAAHGAAESTLPGENVQTYRALQPRFEQAAELIAQVSLLARGET